MPEVRFPLSDLRLVADSTPVEYIGGPNDGERLPICQNGRRVGGLYVPVNEGNRCTAMRFVPDEDGG